MAQNASHDTHTFKHTYIVGCQKVVCAAVGAPRKMHSRHPLFRAEGPTIGPRVHTKNAKRERIDRESCRASSCPRFNKQRDVRENVELGRITPTLPPHTHYTKNKEAQLYQKNCPKRMGHHKEKKNEEMLHKRGSAQTRPWCGLEQYPTENGNGATGQCHGLWIKDDG